MDGTPAESERTSTHFIMNTITTLRRALLRMGAKPAPISRAHFASLDAPLTFVRPESYRLPKASLTGENTDPTGTRVPPVHHLQL